MSRQCADVLGALRRVIAAELRRVREHEGRTLSVLDVGCWDGSTTSEYRAILGGSARGIEVFPAQAAAARARGVDVAEIDLESMSFPWPDESIDVVVANQVFEHLKNVWLPMSEIARVVAPGGYLLFSVPNLASLHNRLLLMLGRQPTSIRTFGPHVRGFTYHQARHFVEFQDFFRTVRVAGAGFYPLPARFARPIANLWTAASHTPVIVARREAPAGSPAPWASQIGGVEIGEQTFYRNNPQAAAIPTSAKH